MNYQNIHDQIIARAIEREQDPFSELGYTEVHHIVPRCMGGSDDKSNLVRLRPEEHYVVHQLLVKIYPGNHKLIYACRAMCMDRDGNRVNNKLYGWLREKCNEENRRANHGRKHSAETRAKIAYTLRGNKNNPKGKVAHNKGKTVSAETRERMKAAQQRRRARNREIFEV